MVALPKSSRALIALSIFALLLIAGSTPALANQPPTANPQWHALAENGWLPITLTGSDPEGAPLTFVVQSGPSHGTLSGTPPALTYHPTLGFKGLDELTFVANDGQLDSTPATIAIQVMTFMSISFGTPGSPVQGQVFVHADGLVVTVDIVTQMTDSQVAHEVAYRCTLAGIEASAYGRVLTVLTHGAEAIVVANLVGAVVQTQPFPEPEFGYPADQLVCCDNRQSADNHVGIAGRGDGFEPLYENWDMQTSTYGEAQRNANGSPPPWECQEAYRGDLQIGMGVFAQSGELGYQKTPLRIAGRGMDYDLTLTYRSRSPMQSSGLGIGWSHNWERTLNRSGEAIPQFYVLSNGYGRADTFSLVTVTAGVGNYVDGHGLYRMVTEEYPFAHVKDRYGTIETYFIPNGLLDRVVDRNGNQISIRYTANCDVKCVIDTMGRVIKYEYEEIGVPLQNGTTEWEERLVRVSDFTGRGVTLRYAYTASPPNLFDPYAGENIGDLIAIESPAVAASDSALGVNGFPNGKVTRFKYDLRPMPLKHNLVTVTEPGDPQPIFRNVYEDDPLAFSYDRVIAQTYGLATATAPNPTSYFLYEPESAAFSCANIWVTEIDRNSNTRRYFINEAGHHVADEVHTRGVRPVGSTEGLDQKIQDLPVYVTTYLRNIDGLILELVAPDGAVTRNTYYEPISATAPIERLKRGNRLETRTAPRSQARARVRGGAPAPGAGGNQHPISERWTYEPAFNQVRTHTSPRGFVTTYDHDAHGNVIQIQHPGSPAAIETFLYNFNGQEIEHTRAEGNVDVTEYDALGYVRKIIRDDRHDPGANSGSPAPPVRAMTEFFRDPLGRVVDTTDPRGVVSRTEWNPLDQVWRVRPAFALSPRAEPGLATLDIETLTFYDAKDRVVQVNRKLDNPGTPDDDSPATPFPDAGYVSTALEYDMTGNKVSEKSEVTPGQIQEIRQFHDGNGNVVRAESAEAVAGTQPLNVVETIYDELNRTYQVVEAPGSHEERTTTVDYYFTASAVAFEIDGRGFDTRHVHDGFGRPLTTIDPVGGMRNLEYDFAGNVVRAWLVGDAGPLGAGQVPSGVWQPVLLSDEYATFDERNRKTVGLTRLFRRAQPLLNEGEQPIKTDGNGDGWVEAVSTYDRESRVVQGTNDNGHSATSTFDGLGRPIAAVDARGNTIETTFDAGGNATVVRSREVESGAKFVTSSAYDAASRSTMVTDNAGGQATTQYDSLGLVTETLDQLGNAVRRSYDGLSRLMRTEWVLTASGAGPGNPDPAQGGGDGLIWESLSYDLNGRITYRQDDNGNVTAFQYSDRNLVIVETHADGSFRLFTYDQNGNVIERVDENGTTVAEGFDELNRLTSVDAQPAAGNPHGIVGSTQQTFAYDGLSRMIIATDDNFGADDASRVEYVYDSLARVIAERQTLGYGTPDAMDGSVLAEVDGVGNVKKSVYPASGREVHRTFDELERLATISESGLGQQIYEYFYAGPARVAVRYSNLNGSSLKVDYDTLKRPTSWRNDGGPLYSEFIYGYDPVGNRLFERRPHDGDEGKVYRYDSAYRLLEALEGVVDGGGQLVSLLRDETFSLDGVGNRIESATKGTPRIQYTTNELNQYTQVDGVALAYDDNGNLLTHDGLILRYDFLNRLREVLLSATKPVARYSYDARGRRVRKDVTDKGPNPGRLTYLHQESRIVEDLDGSNSVVASYVYGSGVDELLLKFTAAGGIHFFDYDSLGSVFAVTDDSGQVLERYRYESYGRPIFLEQDGQTERPSSVIDNRHLFTGRELDAETALYYYRARYYSASLGRFLSRDPAGFIDGLNLYAYVENDPINATDPLGLNKFRHERLQQIEGAGGSGNYGGGVPLWGGPRGAPAYTPGGRVTPPAGPPKLPPMPKAPPPAVPPAQAPPAPGGGVAGGGAARSGTAPTPPSATPQPPTGRLGSPDRSVEGRGGTPQKPVDTKPPEGSGPANSGNSGAGAAGSSSGDGRVHSRYADGTPVLEGQQPPRIPGPDPAAKGTEHTRLRIDDQHERVYQGREFDAQGNRVRDVDMTNPTFPDGTPRPGHPGPPHQHRYVPNDPNVGPRSGFRRLGPEPMP